MNRAKRLEPVQRIADDNERRCAEKFALAERRVAECEAKLAELEAYRADYERGFRTRASLGVNITGLRDYQAFLARLTEAVRQQQSILERTRAERDLDRTQWQQAAQRAKAVAHVTDGWKAEEQKTASRQEQRDTDERASRNAAQRTLRAKF
jgi:flagellar FliJ protein